MELVLPVVGIIVIIVTIVVVLLVIVVVIIMIHLVFVCGSFGWGLAPFLPPPHLWFHGAYFVFVSIFGCVFVSVFVCVFVGVFVSVFNKVVVAIFIIQILVFAFPLLVFVQRLVVCKLEGKRDVGEAVECVLWFLTKLPIYF